MIEPAANSSSSINITVGSDYTFYTITENSRTATSESGSSSLTSKYFATSTTKATDVSSDVIQLSTNIIMISLPTAQ